jgi:putative nucleotidyltransferase with HDIG domain
MTDVTGDNVNSVVTDEANNLHPPTVEKLIGDARNLPAAFQILPRLLALLDDPRADCNDLAEIIRIDPSLTTAVFRVCNSVQFAARGSAHSLSQAIMQLGMREVYRVVLEIVTAPSFNGPDASLFGAVDLWQHSLTTAVASQTLAQRLTEHDPEMVFSAGLLHDVGKTVLVRAARKHYIALLEHCADNNRSVKFAEWETFRTDHAEVGGYLLRSWKFPERIAAVVAGHHRPEHVCKEHQPVAALVYAGNVIAYKLGVGNGCPPYVTQPDRDILGMIGLTPQKLGDFDNEILERLQREQQRL